MESNVIIKISFYLSKENELFEYYVTLCRMEEQFLNYNVS